MPRRRPFVLLIALIVVLMLGAGVAVGVGGALGLRFTPVAVPAESAVAAPPRAATAPPALTAIVGVDGDRIRLAATAVADALAARGRPRPTLRPTPDGPTPDGATSDGATGAGGAGAALTVALDPAVGGGPEAYRLRPDGAGLRLEATSVAGAALGLSTVADRIRSGREVLPAAERGAVVVPRLGLRLTDSGAVGLPDDVARFATGTDYSLNTDIVGPALRPGPPWVDPTAVATIAAQFRQFVDHSLAQGYNGIVVPGFLEYVTFAHIGDGHQVYPAGDSHVERARAMVAAFGPVLRYAADLGLRVYLQTDMLALSPPLRDYLVRTVGGLDPTDPRLWTVYQAGLTELFERLPFVSGLMVRIGEGGAVYAQSGWDYRSEIAVTTPAAVRAMLTALLATAGAGGRDVIFRTWTVGVGAVGDLHTNPDAYEQVLGGLDDPHLIVSTKYTLGDFYSHLPFNTTLTVGTQRRIVEFQARREFEGLGALPDDLGPLEQQALRHFLAANPHIEGVWDWAQQGGPLYAGPRILVLRDGFWPLADLNAYALARLARDPDTDPAAITADWARQTFSDDPATVAAIGQVMALSRTAVTQGLYIGPYADNTVRALGLAPPPMMWIFEWDILTGDSAALDSIYAVSRDRLDEAIADGDRATATATRMGDLIAATDPGTWRDPAQRQSFVDTLTYEADLLSTLGAYRTMVLRHVQWLDTGSDAAYDAWRQAEIRYDAAKRVHIGRYSDNRALPAYNLTAADLGEVRADRDPAMAWLARGLLAALALILVLAAVGPRRGWPGTAALRALTVGALAPWRLAGRPVPPGRLDRVLVWVVPALVLVLSRAAFTWFAAPAHLVVTLGGWLLFAGAARLLIGRRDPFLLGAAIGGVALLRTAILLGALATRGPGRYWFDFWTAPGLRTFYVTVAFAGFAWLFVVTALVLRDGYGLLRRRAVGLTLVAAGGALAVLATVVAAIGLERALTIWNDQLAMLPWGLSRILGITVYLGIPTAVPWFAAAAGAVAAVAGTVLTAPGRRAAG